MFTRFFTYRVNAEWLPVLQARESLSLQSLPSLPPSLSLPRVCVAVAMHTPVATRRLSHRGSLVRDCASLALTDARPPALTRDSPALTLPGVPRAVDTLLPGASLAFALAPWDSTKLSLPNLEKKRKKKFFYGPSFLFLFHFFCFLYRQFRCLIVTHLGIDFGRSTASACSFHLNDKIFSFSFRFVSLTIWDDFLLFVTYSFQFFLLFFFLTRFVTFCFILLHISRMFPALVLISFKSRFGGVRELPD